MEQTIWGILIILGILGLIFGFHKGRRTRYFFVTFVHPTGHCNLFITTLGNYPSQTYLVQEAMKSYRIKSAMVFNIMEMEKKDFEQLNK